MDIKFIDKPNESIIKCQVHNSGDLGFNLGAKLLIYDLYENGFTTYNRTILISLNPNYTTDYIYGFIKQIVMDSI